MLREFSHQKVSEIIKKTRIRKSNNHFNQKKEDNDLKHILSYNLKRYNENHLHNSRKMTQADQHTQSSESTL